jgi:uroporphyrin-III C-methyltransferase
MRGVNVKVIPGISSAIAAPASAGIPLTKRGVNESFWVVTGTLSSPQIANDVRLAAKSSATAVVLMGINLLKEIAAIFADERTAMEPIAIIENATMPSQRIIRAVASDIFERAQLEQVNTPAVIVVGQVVDELELVEMAQQSNAVA